MNFFFRVMFTIILYQKVCLAQTIPGNTQALYSVDHYTDDNGLPQNSIKSMAADADGFIWISTEKGLVRFDGHHFHTFDKSNLTAADQSSFKFSIRVETPGDVQKTTSKFVLTAGFENNKAFCISNGKVVLDTVYLKTMTQSFKDRRNDHASTRVFFGYAGFEPEVSIIPLINNPGSFFRCETQQVTYYSNWKKQYEIPFESTGRAGFFLLGNKLFYQEESGMFIHVGQRTRTKYTIAGDIMLNPAFEAAKKKLRLLWRTTADQAFFYLDKNLYEIREGEPGKLNTRLILQNFDFDTNDVNSVLYDEPNGRFYMGTISKGLFVVNKKSFQTITPEKNAKENVFYAQTLFGTSGVLTPTGSVFSLDKQTGKVFTKVLPLIKEYNNVESYSILTDKSGLIWTKKFQDLFCYNASGDQLLNRWKPDDYGVTQLYEGLDGTIWVGTQKAGLFRIDSRDPVIERKPLRIGNAAYLKNATYMIQESKTALWVGTGNGLCVLNPENGVTKRIPGTEKMYIRSIYSPKVNGSELWFTTYEHGVFLYKNDRLVSFPLDKNKYLASAHCIVSDANGFLWFPTNRGLFQISKQDLLAYAEKPFDLYYHYYDKTQGFLTNEFNGGCQPCALRFPDGRVSLPSLDGLVWFVPEKINPETPVHKIITDRYSVEGTVKNIENDTISLPLGPEQVTVYFTTPYFGNVNNLGILYALVRNTDRLSEANWLAVTNGENAINLGKLESGKYYLYIKKKNGFGVNNHVVTGVTIIVPAHWYETSLFNLLSLFFIIVFIFIYIKLRTNYLKEKNQKLESAIKHRTSELQFMLTAMQGSEKQLSRQMHIYSRLIASMSHDVTTPLKLMKHLLGKLSGMMQKEDYPTAKDMTTSISESMTGIVQLVDSLTNYVKTQLHDSEPAMEAVNLKQLVDIKISLFEIAIGQNRNSVQNELPAMLTVNSQAHLLSILVHNLLDNANKHCRGSVISVFSELADGEVHLVIADSGPGMPEDLITWLNTPVGNHTVEEFRELSQRYPGLGLIIVQEMCTQLQIRLFIEVKNGTMVHLIFPEG